MSEMKSKEQAYLPTKSQFRKQVSISETPEK
jgi:hypothetical protein